MFQKQNTAAKRCNRVDCLKVSRLIKVKKGYCRFFSDNLDFIKHSHHGFVSEAQVFVLRLFAPAVWAE